MPTDCRTLFRTAFLLIAIVGVVKSAYSQSGDAAIVDQFFPESLISESQTDFNNGGLLPVRRLDVMPALNVTNDANGAHFRVLCPCSALFADQNCCLRRPFVGDDSR